MSRDKEEETILYQAIINSEGQYSIWPADRGVPKEWQAAGRTGNKQECFDYIKDMWDRMGPLKRGKPRVRKRYGFLGKERREK